MALPTKWMKTSDGVKIEPGLNVFTYDYRWGVVNKDDFDRVMERNKGYMDRGFELTSNDFWFDVTYPNGDKGWMNGERMVTMCPRCYNRYENCHFNRDPGEIGPGIHKDTPSN